MIKSFGTKIALGGVALLSTLALSSAPAYASPTPAPSASNTVQSRETGKQVKDYKGWTVVHWGPGYSSGFLDASVASNRSPRNLFPATNSAARAIGYRCTLFVGNTIFNDRGKLEAGTDQTCTGAFSKKFTTGQFERQGLLGWGNFGSASESAHTGDAIDDVTWTKGCTGTSQAYYRLKAVPWARSSEDGTLHNGPIVYGVKSSNKIACGS